MRLTIWECDACKTREEAAMRTPRRKQTWNSATFSYELTTPAPVETQPEGWLELSFKKQKYLLCVACQGRVEAVLAGPQEVINRRKFDL